MVKKQKTYKAWHVASAFVLGAVMVGGGMMIGSVDGLQGFMSKRTVDVKAVKVLDTQAVKVQLAKKNELNKGEFANLLVNQLGVDTSKNIGCAEDLKGSKYENNACYFIKNGIMPLDSEGRFNSGEIVSKKIFSNDILIVFSDPQCPFCSTNDNNKSVLKDLMTYSTKKMSDSSVAIKKDTAEIIINSVFKGEEADLKGFRACCPM